MTIVFGFLGGHERCFECGRTARAEKHRDCWHVFCSDGCNDVSGGCLADAAELWDECQLDLAFEAERYTWDDYDREQHERDHMPGRV